MFQVFGLFFAFNDFCCVLYVFNSITVFFVVLDSLIFLRKTFGYHHHHHHQYCIKDFITTKYDDIRRYQRYFLNLCSVHFLQNVFIKTLRHEHGVTQGQFVSWFSFSFIGYLTKGKEPSLPNYLPIAGEGNSWIQVFTQRH